jgi:transmembrane sensor
MANATIRPGCEMIAAASAWFIEFRTDSPNQARRDRFNAWLRTSPQHIQAYFEVATAWSELPDEDPEKHFDIEQMIRAVRETNDPNIVELGARFKPPLAPRQFSFSMKASAIAACVLAVSIAAGAFLYGQLDTYSTATGEQRSLNLADGSSVELNAQSRIRIRYTERERYIDLLKGQALFHVAKDPKRPFIVGTGETQVRAVGTQFDVYRKPTGTIVTVLEGRVAVTTSAASLGHGAAHADRAIVVDRTSTPDRKSIGASASRKPDTRPQILLAAGEQLAIQKSTAMKLAHPDIEAATAWTHKRLVFEDTPLSEVAEEFNRYNVRPLVIADRELGKMGVSGLYSSSDSSALIAFLRAQPGIVIIESDAEILITRK